MPFDPTYYTWNPQLHFEVIRGGPVSEEFVRRTLQFSLTDQSDQFDSIEWTLNNEDGLLTSPAYLALGVIVRVKVGYLGSPTPWRTMLITRVKGGVGVSTDEIGCRAIGEAECKVTYSGRNRNARGPKTNRVRSPADNPRPAPKQTKSSKPRKSSRVNLVSTSDITQWDMALKRRKAGSVIPGRRLSDVVKYIAEDNGFTDTWALIEPSPDTLAGGAYTVDHDVPDAYILSSLANRVGFIFKVDDLGLHWHSPGWTQGQSTHVLREYTYGGHNVLGLSIDGDYRLPTLDKVTGKGLDPTTRIEHVVSASGQSTGTDPVVDVIDQDRMANLSVANHVINTPGAGGVAPATVQESFIASHLQTFKIILDLVGDPGVLASCLVRVKGTGSKLVDRVWAVQEATHTFSGTDYKTRLTLRPPRNAGIPLESIRWEYVVDRSGSNAGTGPVRESPKDMQAAVKSAAAALRNK